MQRESKLTGSIFLDLIVFNCDKLKAHSLNDLSIDIKKKHNIGISKQGLHERFNSYALSFLKMTLGYLLQSQLEIKPLVDNLKGIQRILIKDSVCFDIDSSLAEYYPGSGGSASKAAVRIQFEFDVLTGKINDLSVGAFNTNDNENSINTIELTQKGDLIIRDLGYMNLEVLTTIVKQIEGYFISRLNPSVYIYEQKNGAIQKIDFVALLAEMKRNNVALLEKLTYLGEKDRLPVRLIIHRLPENIVAERIRRANLNNKKKKRGGLGKESKARMAFNLFITNTTDEQIPTKKVWELYRVRWQIEMIFKIWKSVCEIDKVKKVNKYRLECYIYSRLIFIVLCWQFFWKIANIMFNVDKKVMSQYKAYKTIIRHEVDHIRNIFIWKKTSLNKFVNDFYELSLKNHLYEKKKGSITSLDILLGL